ncbi:YfbM family protein [Streptomyces caniferus]|uniref:YfbM family protein n=2 Tax=Streptomyces caniferus TaxID=285557 RepID=A0ABZ1VIA0_9ACTN|nr:YfbM family protein [Streptomyces caniferus]
MSMIGEYARVTPAELHRALGDPEWALALVGGRMEAEAEQCPRPELARCLDIDKAWDALGFLLRRAAFPVDIVHGEEAVPDADDWGYGPPRYLTPERVRAAAGALAGISGERLTAGVGPEDLAEAAVYPAIVWERGASLDFVSEHYELLRPFFRAAADEGDGMLMWLG